MKKSERDVAKITTTEVVKKKPTKEQSERMSRILEASIDAGMTPGELEDKVYREMFE